LSASAPATNERKKNGSAPTACTSATWSGPGAMSAICHDAPTVWMRLPNEDASEAHQKTANTR
jgi:hypothetical protein